jgi:hypothetical protein
MKATTTITETIGELVRWLAVSRHMQANAQAKIKEIEDRIAQSEDGLLLAEMRDIAAQFKAAEAQEYAELCAMALDVYEATGDTGPHPAVKIKLFTTTRYDPIEARTWAAQHMNNLLVLDAKGFEKVAKVAELAFVQIETEPKPTVSSDLTKYL